VHPSAFHPGETFNLGDFLQGLGKLVEHEFSQFLIGHFPASEQASGLDLVAFLQKFPGLAYLDFQVVGVDLGSHANFLDDGGGRPTLSLQLFLLLVFEFPVIENLAYRRSGIGGDRDEGEARSFGWFQSIRGGSWTDLHPFRVDEEDLTNSDASVDAVLFSFRGSETGTTRAGDGELLGWGRGRGILLRGGLQNGQAEFFDLVGINGRGRSGERTRP